jgi:hypothetical protein
LLLDRSEVPPVPQHERRTLTISARESSNTQVSKPECQAWAVGRVINAVKRTSQLHRFLVAGLVLAIAAPAAAADTIAPPGNAGAQEYLEAVPTAGGGKVGGSSGKPGSGTLSKRDRSSLAAQGSDGKAAAALAETSAPAASHTSSPAKKHHHSKSAPAAASSDPAPSGGGPSLAAASAKTVGGKGGMGAALPIVLAVALVGAAGLALLRRRSRAS